jgi:tetratricopeptide (TPR) repeat protein
MKSILAVIIFLLGFISIDTFAQPGDPDLKLRLQYFRTIQDSIEEQPENLHYRWARADLLFNPITTLWTKPTEKLEEFLKNSSQFELYLNDTIVHKGLMSYMHPEVIISKTYNPASELGVFLLENQSILINDLTDLIESGIAFDSGIGSVGCFNTSANKAHFLYKRGQFYNQTGQVEKAIEDFLLALKNDPTEQLKERIYTSIASFYYNSVKLGSYEHYKSTLHSISIIEPAIEDSSYFTGTLPLEYKYEEPKLEIMRMVKDSISYVNYLQNRSVSYLNYYYSLMETEGKDKQYYTSDQAFKRSREYELMIYNYLIELNPKTGADEFKKHKKLIIEKI